MDYVRLGRTGLQASVMGLGCGGHSRLGQSAGRSEEESARLVREAVALGVNFFDTAESYRTEAILAHGLEGVRREEVILSTKKTTWRHGAPVRPQDVAPALEASLARLHADCVDVYHLHAVRPDQYRYAREALVPELLRLRAQGKLRFLGITELFEGDPQHTMLQQALRDDCWDVIMVGFNVLNQTARRVAFPAAQQRDVGTLIMFAVRRALSHPGRLREVIAELKRRRQIGEKELDEGDPLGFLVRPGAVVSVVDAAYRFCRHEPGAHVVLSGTGSLEHLRANAASLCRADLPPEDRAGLERIFARVDDISGN